MRFKSIDYTQGGIQETSVEIKPDLRQIAIIAMVAMAIFAVTWGGKHLFRARQAWADEMLYHHLDREWPGEGRLVYVLFNDDCLHLARFDLEQGGFFDHQGYFSSTDGKWLYMTDQRPADVRFCTKKDLILDG